MGLQTSAYAPDLEARELRDKLRLACLRGSDAELARIVRDVHAFCTAHPEYVLLALVPSALPDKPEPPKRIEAQWSSACTRCHAFIEAGSPALWTPGTKGLTCLRCK